MAGVTASGRLSTLLTVPMETPASRATSLMLVAMQTIRMCAETFKEIMSLNLPRHMEIRWKLSLYHLTCTWNGS
jgi:hypothetical protein